MSLVVAKSRLSGDPVIKYTSLSCGPRSACFNADQFLAPGGMIAIFHPKTQIKHYFMDTGHEEKGGGPTAEGHAGIPMDQGGGAS